MAQKAEPKGYPVYINIYDLSQGMAKLYSAQLIGKQVDGIWHTGVVVYEKEYFYGGGIQNDTPAGTPYGTPAQTIQMGHTFIDQSTFHEFLEGVANKYSPSKYDLFKHNCNTFANEAMEFLNERSVPEFITGLPEEFLNSQVGQMLKPMIDNMQNNAMAAYGDFAGMGIAARPNLPPLNPKYNITFEDSDDNENDDIGDDDDVEQLNDNDKTMQNDEPEVYESKQILDDLKMFLTKYYKEHSHKSLNLKVIPKEMKAKMTVDVNNASLYAKMISRNSEMVTDKQTSLMHELVKFIERKKAAKKKGLNIKLKLSDESLQLLDDLLLMSSTKDLFPIVSLLRLLLVYPEICRRYNDNMMIINQMLYKINIPFETLEFGANNNEKNKKEMDEKENKNENQDEIEMVDVALLQFSAIAAVSHFYSQNGLIKVSEEFVFLALNAMMNSSCNVRLSGSRLLFNIVLQLKREYITELMNKEKNNENNDILNGIKKHLKMIVDVLVKTVITENHEPTKYRCLSTLGLVFYCNDELLKDCSSLNLKQINNDISDDVNKLILNDVIAVVAC